MAILTDASARVLLMLRDDREDVLHRGRWSLVGGGLEADETALDAMHREILEEIGVEVDASYLCEVVDREGRGDRIAIFVARLEHAASDLRLGEGQEVRFFARADLAALDIPSFARFALGVFYRTQEGHAR